MAKAKPKRKAAPKKAAPTEVYQLKVTLDGLKPPVWRRVLVDGNATLDNLHWIIQLAMGWTNSHMHDFVSAGRTYGMPGPYALDDALDEGKFRLKQVAPAEQAKFRYEYDFGDDWRHTVLVEKILPPEPDTPYPVCVKGTRNCPPEDCGGIWGYADFLAAMADLNHPEHDDLTEWHGGPFDPEAFDLDEVNARLRRYA